MRDIVVIRPGDRRPDSHRKLPWRKTKVIDLYSRSWRSLRQHQNHQRD
jgi:hypothetical protein